jgi:transcriptional regulator with XRE-family HTH domain
LISVPLQVRALVAPHPGAEYAPQIPADQDTIDSNSAIGCYAVRMIAARLLEHARRRSGLSQRALARAAGVPHSTVARIELGRLSPRTDTLERLLRVAGGTLTVEPAQGLGVDRSQIRELLRLTPGERARLAAADAAALLGIERSRR